MIDIKQFLSAVKQIAEEKSIAEDNVIATIEAALAAAYKRDYGKKGQIIKVKMDPQTGKLFVTQTHYVIEGVDEEGYVTGKLPNIFQADEKSEGGARPRRDETEDLVESQEGELKMKYNPEKHLLLEDVKKTNKKAAVGDEITVVLEPKSDFGRIAAQTAKQVVIQRLREAERDAVFKEFKEREGRLVSGVIQRKEGQLVFVDIGKTNGILAPIEQMPTDNYRIGQRLRFVILRVEETSRGPAVILSRATSRLVVELFRIEVPEIDATSVEIKAVAREAGSRTKIAVISKDEGIDPIGSLVGQKGVRVQTVINELAGEKIDIILWDSNPRTFVSNALSPAKILDVKVVDEDKKIALAEVSDDQFSLAIGKRGQNVRLAAKLTGWKIDVRSPKEVMTADEAVVEVEAAPVEPTA